MCQVPKYRHLYFLPIFLKYYPYCMCTKNLPTRWTPTRWSRWPATWTWWCLPPSLTRKAGRTSWFILIELLIDSLIDKLIAAQARCRLGRNITPASSARATGFWFFANFPFPLKIISTPGSPTKHHLAKGGWSTDLQRLPQNKTEADWELGSQGGVPWSAGLFQYNYNTLLFKICNNFACFVYTHFHRGIKWRQRQ